MYCYTQHEPGLYIVGHYAPDGTFWEDKHYRDRERAADRVSFLNGGSHPSVYKTLSLVNKALENLERYSEPKKR